MISTCKRGHDTSYPEARFKDRRCKKCALAQSRIYSVSEHGKYLRRQRDKKYYYLRDGKLKRQTAEYRYAKMKYDLRYRIGKKIIKIAELETQLGYLERNII